MHRSCMFQGSLFRQNAPEPPASKLCRPAKTPAPQDSRKVETLAVYVDVAVLCTKVNVATCTSAAVGRAAQNSQTALVVRPTTPPRRTPQQ